MADLYITANTNSINSFGNGQKRPVEGTRDGAIFTADWKDKLALAGRVFQSAEAAANTTILGQTSFADTTPTLLLDVPNGTTMIPLKLLLQQAGTVAGGAISVLMALSVGAISFASGGAVITPMGARTDKPVAPSCSLYTNPTATTGLDIKHFQEWLVGQDISTAEGAVDSVLWTPQVQGHDLFVVGPASLAIFTFAASTGPTWLWNMSWAEVPSNWITG